MEIIASTASNSPASRPADGETSPDNFFDASDKPMEVNVYKQDESTTPAANTFTAIQSSDEWLKRYLSDGHNSQLGNISNKVEVTTKDGEEWYGVRIPYLHRFYDTEIYLVGKQNNYIYALRGDENEVVCMKTLWTPYNLVALEELLRNNQYLRLKGIKSFEEEGEAILNKLVSIKRKLLEGIDFRRMLNYSARQKLYERRLKLTKALTIIIEKEMEHLEEENQDRVMLSMTKRAEFTAGLQMIIDQIVYFGEMINIIKIWVFKR